MSNNERIEKTREYIDAVKERIDTFDISDDDREIMDEFLTYFELLIENRESVYTAMSMYILPGYKRMSDVLGTEDDQAVIELMEAIVQ